MTWQDVVSALRSEGATPRVYVALMAHLEPRARRATQRWGRSAGLGAEDVAQEMAVATWRAVDAFSGDAADLAKHAALAARTAARDALRRASGWPDPRRAPLAFASAPFLDAPAQSFDIDAAVALRLALDTFDAPTRAAVVTALEGFGTSRATQHLKSGTPWARRVAVEVAVNKVAALAA